MGPRLAPSRPRRLTAVVAALLALAAAPTAAAEDRVAFSGADGVVIRELDGAQRRLVGVDADRLAWSPDGSQMAIERFASGVG